MTVRRALAHPRNPPKGREKTQSSKAEEADAFNATQKRINLTTEKAGSHKRALNWEIEAFTEDPI